MAFRAYGGYVWNDQQTQPQYSLQRKAGDLALAVGLGAGALGLATIPFANGTRPLDTAYAASRLAGNLSPLSILNTFRTPEFLSPLISPVAQGMTDIGGGVFQTTIAPEFLGSGSTHRYLQAITGRTADELHQAGLRIGDIPGDTSLVFERTAQSRTGSLFTQNPNGRTLLSSNIMLQQATPDTQPLIPNEVSVNRALQAHMQVLGLTEKEGFKTQDVFRSTLNKLEGHGVPKFAPISSSLATYARGFGAFGQERLNSLVRDVGRQVPFLGDLNQGLDRLIGTNLVVRSGPGLRMFARFGFKGAAVLGLGIGISQTDWMRRNYGVPGQVAGAGITSAGIGYGFHQLGFGNRFSFIAATASFFGQMVMPGFSQGVVPGIATTYTHAQILRAHNTPANLYRRTLEGYLPGVSDWKTGALLGVLGVGAAYLPMGIYRGGAAGRTLPQFMFERLGAARFGIEPEIESVATTARMNVRQLFWQHMENQARESGVGQQTLDRLLGNRLPLTYKRGMMAYHIATSPTWKNRTNTEFFSYMNSLWQDAENLFREQGNANPLNVALQRRLERITGQYAGKGFIAEGLRNFHGAAAGFIHGIFGSDLTSHAMMEQAARSGFLPKLGRAGMIFGGIMLAQQLLTGGLLGSMKDPQQLKDEYSGQKLVAIKKGRFWEGGGTPFEGGVTQYYRPHWYSLMMNRVRQKGIWGSDEDSRSPIRKFLSRNFTYNWEREHYYDRPYPMSNAAFSDVPIIGGILGATVGRLIKPPKIMHADQWIQPGPNGLQYASVYEGSRREPAYSLGGVGPGIPSSPYSTVNLAARALDQSRQMSGMTGWFSGVMQKLVTGSSGIQSASPLLATSGDVDSISKLFYETETGGGLFSNEVVRRFLWKDSTDRAKLNPITNSMPTWMPDRFHYGDPYRTVEWGEARLPGPGFEAVHPELKGVDPEAYPTIYKMAVLGDVAPYSVEFQRNRTTMYKRRQAGKTTPSENQYMDYIDQLANQKLGQRDFTPVNPNAIMLPGSKMTQGLWGAAKRFIREMVAPAEYVIPMGFRPFQKLMGDRGPIEQYEYARLYGSEVAFWDRPWRDWFRPSLYSAAHMMGLGFKGKPGWRVEADQTGEYFDKLDFIRWMRLAEEARVAGDVHSAIKYEYAAGQTRTGVNPMGNPMGIYWALPAEERPYFNAFSNAQGKERERILQMIPSDEQQLYQTIWSRKDSGDPELWAGSKVSIDDHYLAKRFGELQNVGVPREDWIGWHSDVRMDDIKVLYVDHMGKDVHDFGLWENQLREAQQQPYLEGAIEPALDDPTLSRSRIAGDYYRVLSNGMTTPNVWVNSYDGSQSHGNLVWNDNREQDIYQSIRDRLDE